MVGTVAHAGPAGRRRSSERSSRSGTWGSPRQKMRPTARPDRVQSLGPVGEGGYGVGTLTASTLPSTAWWPPVRYRTFSALVSAGFRRYSTYRQATLAGIFTNIVFGSLRCYVFLAVAGGIDGNAVGYRGTQIVAYVWVTQGLISTVGM